MILDRTGDSARKALTKTLVMQMLRFSGRYLVVEFRLESGWIIMQEFQQKEQAVAWLDEHRDSFVNAKVMSEQEWVDNTTAWVEANS
jgi:hypothetical protein